nr:testis derived transcript [Danio rerio]
MEIEKEVKKITLGHEIGAGAACLKCKDKCEGFELHFWRKICRNCKCGVEDHDVQLETEESKKVGKLFEDTKYNGLIAKLKRDGIPSYRSNQFTVSVPAASLSSATAVPAGVFIPGSNQTFSSITPPGHAPSAAAAGTGGASNPPGAPGIAPTAAPGAGRTAGSAGQVMVVGFPLVLYQSKGLSASTIAVPAPTAVPAKTDVVKSVTYEWAPPGINQSLALRYMELLPPEQRPIAGTTGADYRKKQMAKQLPDHDQDPERCHELSPGEIKQMQQYVRKYKDEALGIGDITLPEEMGHVGAAGDKGPQGVGAGGKPGAGTTGASGDKGDAVATVGKVGAPGAAGTSAGGPAGNFSCHQCQKPMKKGEPAVFAERAGYDKLWHPACLVCCTCTELLVDMIYFWKKGSALLWPSLWETVKTQDVEAVMSSSSVMNTLKPRARIWHLKHFCCFDCDCVLAGETYVMEKEKPVCKPCYMKNHAVCCVACQKPIEPESQRVSYGEHHWHAEPQCFQCAGCSKCLMGQRFMALQGKLICSVECKKKISAS